jgi:hypothetical protein
MKKIFLYFSICLCFACSDSNQQKVNKAIDKTGDSLSSKLSKLNDTLKAAKERTIDKLPKVKIGVEHTVPIALQWIGSPNRGKASLMKQDDDWFSLKGEQTNQDNEFLKIDGRLKRIDEFKLQFEGTIITYIKANNGGVPCEKKGSQIFLKKGDRKYYRLQNMVNCEGGRLLDYVDLYEIDGRL